MYYEEAVLEKAVNKLFDERFKVNVREKLGFSWGRRDEDEEEQSSDHAWLISFARRKLIMVVAEDELNMDIPSYIASGGSAGLVVEALFYVSEDLEQEYLNFFQSFYDRKPKQDKRAWLKSKSVLHLPVLDEGYFYVYAVARFDFKEILKSKNENDSLLYPDHLSMMPEPKLGLRYALVDLVFNF